MEGAKEEKKKKGEKPQVVVDEAKFVGIGLEPSVVKTFKDKKVIARLEAIIDMAGGSAEKSQGTLLYHLSTKLPPTQDPYTNVYVEYIMSKKWSKKMQVDEAIEFLKDKLKKEGEGYKINHEEFDGASGVGVNLTDADLQKLVDDTFNDFSSDIQNSGWGF